MMSLNHVENGLNTFNISVAVLAPDVVQPSLNRRRVGLFCIVKYLALTGVTLQVVGVKVNLLIREPIHAARPGT
jgi:hypothetical protein